MRISDWSSDVCSSDLDPRGQVIGTLDVQDVGDGGVVALGPGQESLAELLPVTHPGDQARGDRRTRLVGGEGGQHVRVPGPLLEHLAGRLDEVPLGGDPGEPDPLVPSRQHVVQQVAELVEQGDHLAVLHPPPRVAAGRRGPRGLAYPARRWRGWPARPLPSPTPRASGWAPRRSPTRWRPRRTGSTCAVPPARGAAGGRTRGTG